MTSSEQPDSNKDQTYDWVLVEETGNSEKDLHHLIGRMIFIGREECDVTLPTRSVDKRHAVLNFDTTLQHYQVKDLNSANGTYVNDLRIPDQSYVNLQEHDRLRFGHDSTVYQIRKPSKDENLETKNTIIDEPTSSSDEIPTETSSETTSSPDGPVRDTGSGIGIDIVSTPDTSPDENFQHILDEHVREICSPSKDDFLLSLSSPLMGSILSTVCVDSLSECKNNCTNSADTIGESSVPPVPSVQQENLTDILRVVNTNPGEIPVKTPTSSDITTSHSNISIHSNFSDDSLTGVESSSKHDNVDNTEILSTTTGETVICYSASQQQEILNDPDDVYAIERNVPNEILSSKVDSESEVQSFEADEDLTMFPMEKTVAPQFNEHNAAWWEKQSFMTQQQRRSRGNKNTEKTPSNIPPCEEIEEIITSHESHPIKDDPKNKPYSPMAFTIDFGEGTSDKNMNVRKLDIGDSISKFAPRHRRNLSLTKVDENKKNEENKMSKFSPTVSKKTVNSDSKQSWTDGNAREPVRKGRINTRVPSSYQVPKFSTREHRSVPSTPSQPELYNPKSPALNRSTSYLMNKFLNSQPIRVVDSKPEEIYNGCDDHDTTPSEEEELEKDNVSEAETYTIEKDSPSPDVDHARQDIDRVFGVNDQVPNRVIKNGINNFVVSPRNASSPDVDMSAAPVPHGTSNWIHDWAVQVSQQRQKAPPDDLLLNCTSVLKKKKMPDIKTGQTPSPVNSRPPFPPSINQENRPRRRLLPNPPVNQVPLILSSPHHSQHSDDGISDKQNQVVNDVRNESSWETESYLRDTESVVTAMQARMGQNLLNCKATGSSIESQDSGGESDYDHAYLITNDPGVHDNRIFSAELRAKLQALEKQNGNKTRGKLSSATAKRLQQRTNGLTGDHSILSDSGYDAEYLAVPDSKGYHSDSSSDVNESKYKETPDKPPSTRYNRAFSLRRGRLDADNTSSTCDKKKGLSSTTNKSQTKPPTRQIHSAESRPPIKTTPNQFNRVDGGRYSLRMQKNAAQLPPHPTKPPVKSQPTNKPTTKELPKKINNVTGRSNSTLSSKEVEFQNWKRRKSYDPMKAAAEGRKKEAAAKKSTNSTVVEKPTVSQNSGSGASRTPSPPTNCVLRSQSFHGTGAIANSRNALLVVHAAFTSEEEISVENYPTSPKLIQQVPRSDIFESKSLSRRMRVSALLPVSSASDGGGVDQGSRESSPSLRKCSLDESLLDDNKTFARNVVSTSSLRSRVKCEALDALVLSALHGLSSKVKGSFHNVLSKLRDQYDPDSNSDIPRLLLDDILQEIDDGPSESPVKSPSRDLSGTLKNLKKIEQGITVLDRILFNDEDEELQIQHDNGAWNELQSSSYY